MSLKETPLTRWYWSEVGGTLVEEFRLTGRSATSSARWVDGLIIPDGPHMIAHQDEADIAGKHVIAVQTKAARLGMSLMGQTVFSQMLLEKYHGASRVSAVALCERDDDVLRPLLEAFEDVSVVIAPDSVHYRGEAE